MSIKRLHYRMWMMIALVLAVLMPMSYYLSFLASGQPNAKYPDDLPTNYKSAVDQSSIQIEEVVELLLREGLD
jgi:hypothetical protein